MPPTKIPSSVQMIARPLRGFDVSDCGDRSASPAGEASVMMNIQEMSTIAQYRLPVKVFILNNEYMGMVRQWQELFFDNRYSFVNLENPDFQTISRGFGIPATLGHWARKLSVSKYKGTAFNNFLPAPSVDHIDTLSGQTDSCTRVRVTKI